MKTSRCLAPLLCLLAFAIPAATATARTNIAVGVASESASMFAAPAYQALHLKHTRYFVPWDAVKDPTSLASADAFVNAANAQGVKVLMHVSTDTFTHGVAKLPSVASYKKYVSKLIAHFKPMGVTEWGTWNEENHVSEPTYRSPKRAAQFYSAMRKMCKGCTVVALDLLDARAAPKYVKSFYKALSASDRKHASLIGIHNYEDVNYKRTKGTKGIIDAVHAYNRKAKFWITETGGLVNLEPHFPCDANRAASRTKYMFTLAKHFKAYVKRLYIYSWQGAGCSATNTGTFDAGLVDENGTPRPSYTVLQQELPSFTR